MQRQPWSQIRFLALFVAALVLASCSKEAPPPEAAVRPVKTVVIEGAGGGGVREFPGRIEANRRAELSFRVPGTINEIHVREGDTVQQGQLLAELDKTDYRIAVNNQQAQFDNAEKNFKRAQDLIESGAISKMDFDRMEANFKTTQAGLEAARQDLAYTEMTAPFAGVIARRHVQNFEQVLAKQAIFSLQQVDLLEVKVDIPERIVRRLTRPAARASDSEQARAAHVVAFFAQDPDTVYPLHVKEVATKADPSTQTFEVTFTMPAPEGVTALPGMTVSVRADLSGLMSESDSILIPASAVGGSDALQPQVWVVDEEDMTVHPQQVRLGEIEGDRIQVLEGLVGGERVVVAGIGALADGMRVSLMQGGEQAEPRSE